MVTFKQSKEVRRLIELTPPLDGQRNSPLYQQIYAYVRTEIMLGRITAGTKLPSPRILSTSLGVSKTTVDTAYEQLMAEGYIDSQPRRGYYVTALEVDLLNPGMANEIKEAPQASRVEDKYIDFHTAKIDARKFPFSVWKKITSQAMDNLRELGMSYGHPFGSLGLRRELAKYLRYARGVSCSEDQIMIYSGVQQAIGLICQFLREEYRSVGFENPGYHDARLTFQKHGYDVKPVDLDSDGLDVEKLSASGTRLVYITPGHQFPLGIVMPMSRRLALLKWAKQVDGYIIEDDYDSEFRYSGHPIPCLQGIEADSRVIYMGTFSKTLMPAIRVSYMIIPKSLMSRFRVFLTYDNPVSGIHQETLKLFMERGEWDHHIRRMRKTYHQKRRTLIDALSKHLGNRIQVFGDQTGLHVGIKVVSKATVQELTAKALQEGVKVYSLADAWTPPHRNEHHLFMGFGALAQDDIVEGVQRLKRAWAE
jgi:GntR family transcriptional regulator / MocR family aminotransferase